MILIDMKKELVLLCFLFTTMALHAQILIGDHEHAVGLITRARHDIENKKYLDAIGNLKSAIALDSTIRVAYLYLFQACYCAKDYEIAKVYLQKAKCIFLEDDEVIYYLGKIFQAGKSYDTAISEFSEAIHYSRINGEDYPVVYDYYASRGVCYLQKEEYKAALEDFNYSIKLNNKKGSVYANKGIALYKLNRLEEACQSWEKAYELGETSVREYIEKNCK